MSDNLIYTWILILNIVKQGKRCQNFLGRLLGFDLGLYLIWTLDLDFTSPQLTWTWTWTWTGPVLDLDWTWTGPGLDLDWTWTGPDWTWLDLNLTLNL